MPQNDLTGGVSSDSLQNESEEAPDGDALRQQLGGPSPTAPTAMPSRKGLLDEHSHLSAQYDKLQKTERKLEVLRSGIDRLATLRDMVTPEDVTEEAGKLASSGVSTTELASILAQMPTANGEVLAGWLAQQEAQLAESEQNLQHQLSVTRYMLGGASMKMLAAAHLMHQLSGGAAQQGNPMMEPSPASPPSSSTLQ